MAQLPRLLMGLDPAFRLTPSLDPDLLRWGIAFLRNASAGRFRRNTLAGMMLAIESRAALDRLTQRHGIEFARSAPGKLILYRSAKSFATAARVAAMKAEHGARQSLIDAGQAVAIEPALGAIRPEIAGAVFDLSLIHI